MFNVTRFNVSNPEAKRYKSKILTFNAVLNDSFFQVCMFDQKAPTSFTKRTWTNGGSSSDYRARNTAGRTTEDTAWTWKDGAWTEERGLFPPNVNSARNFTFSFVLPPLLRLYFTTKYYESWTVLTYDWRNRQLLYNWRKIQLCISNTSSTICQCL